MNVFLTLLTAPIWRLATVSSVGPLKGSLLGSRLTSDDKIKESAQVWIREHQKSFLLLPRKEEVSSEPRSVSICKGDCEEK